MIAKATASWHLRPAQEADVPAVASLFRASFRLLDFLPTLHTPEEDRAFFAQVVRRERVTLADSGCDVLGFASETEGWLHQLYVAPRELGRGVGSALLRHAQARQARLELWCFQRNARARRFYEAHSFAPVEFTDGARNEEKEPDVRYLWQAPAL